MKIENTSIIYYMDFKGCVQDGAQWLDDYKHGDITLKELEGLKECYWSALKQEWVKES